MSTILVTGGAGFIGSHTVRTLIESGHDVAVMDTFTQYVHPVPPSFEEDMRWRFDVLLRGARLLHGSTTHKDELRRVLSEVAPDGVVHLAGLPLANVAAVRTEEAFNTILGGTVNLLEAVRDMDKPCKVLYVSSSMIYGDFAFAPMPEDGPKAPKDIYGGMKYAGETVVRVFGRQFGIPYAIVRPSAVYGPTDHNDRVVQSFVHRALAGKTLPARNPNSTILDFTYVEDVAQGLEKVLLSPESCGEAFNITRGEGRSLTELIECLRRHSPDLDVLETHGAKGDFRPIRGALDISKARRVIGYEPRFSLEAGLASYIRFMWEHNRSISDRARMGGKEATSVLASLLDQ
jgi:nucleoside-diphosphate-sugar epimerase